MLKKTFLTSIGGFLEGTRARTTSGIAELSNFEHVPHFIEELSANCSPTFITINVANFEPDFVTIYIAVNCKDFFLLLCIGYYRIGTTKY